MFYLTCTQQSLGGGTQRHKIILEGVGTQGVCFMYMVYIFVNKHDESKIFYIHTDTHTLLF